MKFNLKKYNKNMPSILRGKKGEEIIGTEVDENNQLHYVIKEKDGFTTIKYNEVKIKSFVIKSPKITETHSGN